MKDFSTILIKLLHSTLSLVALLVLTVRYELSGQTQVYPVSVTTQIVPPYSVNLADYAAPGSNQLRVIIVQRDMTQAAYRLYLRMEIQLNGRTIIRTSPEYFAPALTLDPGMPTVISGSDLSSFFDPANMEFTGYSRDEYMRTKLLPEGAYVITFTAYDYSRRDVALSYGGAFFCYLAKSEPPMLNLPINNSSVPCTTPQYINFQWLPRTVTSPNSAFSTRYRLELHEIRIGGMSPDEIVNSTRPVFITETDRTAFSYSINEPQLETGMRYVWRVRALDMHGRDYIRNDGYSEVFSFFYGEKDKTFEYGSIQNFVATAVSPRKAKAAWDHSPAYESYKVFYRKQGNVSRWYEKETPGSEIEISGLAPGEIYECRIQGKAGNTWGSPSDIDTVKMPKLPVVECGSPFIPAATSNRYPLAELMRLQEFDAGGFMVTVTDPYAVSTRPGVFSGKGFVQVPIFGHKKIRCVFTDIFINTDYQMVQGVVRLLADNTQGGDNAIWDTDEIFEGGTENGSVIQGTEEASIIIPEVIIAKPENIVLDTSGKEIIVVTASQDSVRINIEEKLKDNPQTLTVKDSEGNLYTVETSSGKSVYMGQAAPSGSQQEVVSLPQILDNRKGIVKFENAEDAKFAFDAKDSKYQRSNLFTEEYTTIKLYDGSDYVVPFKLIPVGETDNVIATIEKKGRSLNEDSIVFRSGTGTIFKARSTGKKSQYLLTLPSGRDNDGIDVYATYTDNKGKAFVLGKMKVISYKIKRPELVLVPVNGNGLTTDVESIKKYLDDVYLPVAVDWQVRIDGSDFRYASDSLNIRGSGLWSKYTEGMKQLNNEYVMHVKESFNPSAVYLFMLKSSDEAGATGDMPRSMQFGYVFTETARSGGTEALNRTVAHEISHGIFHLSHTFDNQYQIPKGTTDNLMDYTAGTSLVKHQWDAIHDPGLVLGMFERDEDGANILIPNPTYVKEFIEKIRCSYISGNEVEISRSGLYNRSENFAGNVTLSDGNTYGHIFIRVNQTGNFNISNLKIDKTEDKVNLDFGNVFSIQVSGEGQSEFSKYILPARGVYISQLLGITEQLNREAEDSRKIEILKTLSICAYEHLSSTLRLELLKLICSQPIKEHSEKIVLDIVRTTPSDQANDLLAGMTSISVNNKSLITLLIRKVNDASLGMFGEDNYRSLIIALKDLVNRSSDLQTKINSLLETSNIQKKLMNWQVSEAVLGAVKVSRVELSDDGKLTIQRSEVSGITLGPGSNYSLNAVAPVWRQCPEISELEPFELVIFVNNSNLNILNEVTASDKSEITVVPAIFLQYAAHKQFNNDVVQVAAIAADVASIAFSGGTLAFAKNLTNLRKAWLLFEVVNSGINLTLNISGIANNPDFKEAVDTYNKLVILLAIGELSYTGARNLTSIVENVQNAVDATTDEIKLAAQNFVNAVNKVDPAKLSGYEKLKEYADQLIIKYKLVVNKIARSYKGVTFDYFKSSVKDFFANDKLAQEAFEIYKQEKWDELEAFFKGNKINGQTLPDGTIVYWPPANGGYDLVIIRLTKGMKFDRYQREVKRITLGHPECTGTYTSPIVNGKSFNYTSRALVGTEDAYDLYYEIEILKDFDDINIIGEQAKVIPWHGYEGNGLQTIFKFPDASWDLEKLQSRGYIKITIKYSPSGKYEILAGNTIKLK